jgi:hypothetical protein
MSICVYYDTWACKWTDDPNAMNLAKMPKDVTSVILAFANPKGSYKKGSFTFANTGLEFSSSFTTVKGAIQILRNRGVKVLLGVGGSLYQYNTFVPYAQFKDMKDLVDDLGCEGIDIDWEPSNGIEIDWHFSEIIQACKDVGIKYLTAACTGSGVYTPNGNGDGYKGMNIKGIVAKGHLLDAIHIMAYDAGDITSFDPLASYTSYRMYYKGPLLLGFELGPQAWGGYITNLDDIKKACNWVQKDRLAGYQGGIFIWCFHKVSTGSPDLNMTITTARSICPLPNPTPPSPPLIQTPPQNPPITPIPCQSPQSDKKKKMDLILYHLEVIISLLL